MISVPVIKPFTHEGRALNAGDTIDVSPVTAAVLHRRGVVSLTKQYTTTAEPVVAKPKRGGRYRRKDLVAE